MITEYQKYDIYSDIHPFVDTAIKLEGEGVKKDPSLSYINANKLRTVYNEPLDQYLIAAT